LSIELLAIGMWEPPCDSVVEEAINTTSCSLNAERRGRLLKNISCKLIVFKISAGNLRYYYNEAIWRRTHEQLQSRVFSAWYPSSPHPPSPTALTFCLLKASSPFSGFSRQSCHPHSHHCQVGCHAERRGFESSMPLLAVVKEPKNDRRTHDRTPPISPRLYPVAKSLLGPRLPPGLSGLGISRCAKCARAPGLCNPPDILSSFPFLPRPRAGLPGLLLVQN